MMVELANCIHNHIGCHNMDGFRHDSHDFANSHFVILSHASAKLEASFDAHNFSRKTNQVRTYDSIRLILIPESKICT